MRLNLWTIIVVTAIGLGVGFEVLKHAKVRPTDDAALKQALNRMDFEPYARSSGDEGPSKPTTRVAQNTVPKFAENHTMVGTTPPAAPRGVVKYDKSAEDKNKKKKKKKKKVETAKPALEAPEQYEEEEEEEINPENIAAAGEVAPVVANPKADTARLSYDEWAAKLLNQPDPKLVQEFIEAYQSGKVSAEVFYKIVREMIADSREEMSSLGILAASHTPSYSSFVVLIEVLDNSSSSSAAKSRVETALNTYTQMSYLPILESIIRSSHSTTALLAATKRLNTSAQNAKKYWIAKQQQQQGQGGTGGTGGTGTGGGTGTTVTKNPYAKHFTRFVDLLNKIKASNATVSASAQEALNSINQLLT